MPYMSELVRKAVKPPAIVAARASAPKPDMKNLSVKIMTMKVPWLMIIGRAMSMSCIRFFLSKYLDISMRQPKVNVDYGVIGKSGRFNIRFLKTFQKVMLRFFSDECVAFRKK